ncbi:MAG TPA: hypothetical protein VHB20_14565 [Verrucomicrobiae bacterium]|jgi:hypothetical protein|nr:hypothetical protein [Verrucomicrobiae bacterium]
MEIPPKIPPNSAPPPVIQQPQFVYVLPQPAAPPRRRFSFLGLTAVIVGVFIVVMIFAAAVVQSVHSDNHSSSSQVGNVAAPVIAAEKALAEREANIKSCIKEHKICIGMTEEECRLSWGKPRKINSTSTRFGRSEQWVYGDSYVYFDDGVISSTQISRSTDEAP